ncbi:MAG TPA: 4-(cytidine 5'-diphospho)-2-C-methyl-D-erythritol kinase [bacterium]|nr:4-(cytidine 5'-diphospho)-2-C-methyl-D-erythritol kinase [bacterium]
MNRISVKAPAKVNILLRVLGLRPDGYHDLEMVMVPLSLGDEIYLTSIPSGIEISVDGQSDPGMSGEKNLAWRAAALMREASGVDGGVRINLIKRTPVAAGLGGGSSDAAAVLRGLSRMWGLGWPEERLSELGRRLGADVPFFCYDRPAFVEGTGEKITPYDEFPKLSFLLINPGFAVSTPQVYRQWDESMQKGRIEVLTQVGPDARVRPLFKGFRDVISSLHNDLEIVTQRAHPEIAEIKSLLIDLGAAGALMSGSGPTVFGVFEDARARDDAIESTRREGWRVIAAEGMGL